MGSAVSMMHKAAALRRARAVLARAQVRRTGAPVGFEPRACLAALGGGVGQGVATSGMSGANAFEGVSEAVGPAIEPVTGPVTGVAEPGDVALGAPARTSAPLRSTPDKKPEAAPLWRFTDPVLRAAFEPAVNTLHEFVADAYGDTGAASGLALAAAGGVADRCGPLVWISTSAWMRDHGRLCGHGLAQRGLDPSRVMLVMARDDREALWALEEVLAARAAAVVVAELESLDFTASRRLALRAQHTPALLVLSHNHGAAGGATAAQSRWRVSAQASAPDPDDAHGPGAPRWRAVLSRCRAPDLAGPPRRFVLEWSHDALLHTHDGESVVHDAGSQIATSGPQGGAPSLDPNRAGRSPHAAPVRLRLAAPMAAAALAAGADVAPIRPRRWGS